MKSVIIAENVHAPVTAQRKIESHDTKISGAAVKIRNSDNAVVCCVLCHSKIKNSAGTKALKLNGKMVCKTCGTELVGLMKKRG